MIVLAAFIVFADDETEQQEQELSCETPVPVYCVNMFLFVRNIFKEQV